MTALILSRISSMMVPGVEMAAAANVPLQRPSIAVLRVRDISQDKYTKPSGRQVGN